MKVEGAADDRRIRVLAMLKLSRRKGWLNFMISWKCIVVSVCASKWSL